MSPDPLPGPQSHIDTHVKSHFLSIPNELLLVIAEYLGTFGDICRLGQVNHQLHNLLRTFACTRFANRNGSLVQYERTLYWIVANGLHDLAKTWLEAYNAVEFTIPEDNDWLPRHVLHRSPLHYAARRGDPKMVQILQDLTDFDPRSLDVQGESPLMMAATQAQLHKGHESDYREVCRILLRYRGLGNYYAGEKSGPPRTLITFAVERRCTALVELLLEDSRDNARNTRDSRSNATPLVLAAKLKFDDVAKLLMADPRVCLDTCDGDGNTPLHTAAAFGALEICKSLIADESIDLAAKNNQGDNAFALACLHGQPEVVAHFLAMDDIRCKGILFATARNSGNTPLMLSTNRNHASVIKLLLSDEHSRFDPNVREKFGYTALALAAIAGKLAAVEALLADPRTDVNLGSLQGKTPLMLAAAFGHQDVVIALLNDKRLDFKAHDNEGKTALWYARRGSTGSVAVQKGKKIIIELLRRRYVAHGWGNLRESVKFW